MTSRIEIIDDQEIIVITANEGCIFERIHDGLDMGCEIWLGMTGNGEPDHFENYRQVTQNIIFEHDYS